ncbi:glycosyltransferase [Vibrio sp. S11_S32]|uniref:glycosyltransferase n=1 Tax=Vibrio sp. S11_S32 TaxID=2720225 RepID=UPI00167FE812|nr:glycosyltransferase [Vibrio sp. S11_S32]MBD1577789.1 glycosyltransferase [Vibrio sp. S11_S32]
MDKVCILLATYNGGKYISTQLDSILAQVGVSVDIYISLDVSKDDTLEIINDYMGKYENIKLLPYGEKFGSAGKNFFHLIQNVPFDDYDYVSFSDQDDIWLDDKLIESVNFMSKHQAHAYSSNVTAFWSDGREKVIVKSAPQVEFDYIFESAGPGCTFVFSQEAIKSIRGKLKSNIEEQDNLWLHDWFCYSFCRTNGFKWVIDPVSRMRYRQHSDNVVGANSGLKSILTRVTSVLSEDAFIKVINQANYLDQNNKPLKLLRANDSLSLLKLAFLGGKCRRKSLEKIMFFFAVILFSFKRLF